VDNPYQAPISGTTETPRRGIASALVVAVTCFIAGYATPILLFLTAPAPKSCPPPCDGPAMLFMAILFVGGPIVGVIFAVAGVLVRFYLVRRRLKAAA
jgi:hypothetical protein